MVTTNTLQQLTISTIYISCSSNAVIVLDDIIWSKGMKKAWDQLKNNSRITYSIDLNSIRILVLGKSNKEFFEFFSILL